MGKVNVLVLDDESCVREVVQMFLDKEGDRFEVTTVVDLNQAKTILLAGPTPEEKFQIIIFDLNLSDKSSPREVMMTMKEYADFMALSGGIVQLIPMTGGHHGLETTGMFDCLFKPFQRTDLLALVSKAVDEIDCLCSK